MKRVLVVGLMAVLVFLAGVRFGVSYFSDVAKSENNSLSTGQFDIGISRDGGRYYDDYKIFEFGDLLPGEERTAHFYVKNRGDYPVSVVSMVLNVSDLEDGSLSKAEALVDDTPDVGELSKYLIIKDINVTFNGTTISLGEYRGKSLKELNNTQILLFSGKLPRNEAIEVTMTTKLSPDAGNDCQTDTSKVSMLITASQ
ncbi:TasA family protein [Thermococcus sp. Bubb.Bath]|uniref:TasA family protein n=1 Tax=Thermococcus sp. Bubb.Bath TaxID=1638242 RepID=UPI00143886E2|nr:TasA family protein [Thermococcus sp. Bubb.Bath]NJF25193.1 methyltransferase [Thermococcus sp. Bubb.Bath]